MTDKQMDIGQKIIEDIIGFINKTATRKELWYEGITADPEKRLFTDHNVDRNHPWIYSNAMSEEIAGAVKSFLLENYPMSGDSGGGDKKATYVYAYHIADTTVQQATHEKHA